MADENGATLPRDGTRQAELMVRLASFDAQEQLEATTPDLIAIGPGLGFSALARDWLIKIRHARILYCDARIPTDGQRKNFEARTYRDDQARRHQADTDSLEGTKLITLEFLTPTYRSPALRRLVSDLTYTSSGHTETHTRIRP